MIDDESRDVFDTGADGEEKLSLTDEEDEMDDEDEEDEMDGFHEEEGF
jgi:hypothetical protein